MKDEEKPLAYSSSSTSGGGGGVIFFWMSQHQQKKSDDYVIATGKEYTIKEFINKTAKCLKLKLFWRGKGLKEQAVNEKGKIIIKVSKIYFRPLEVDFLKGNAAKARKNLKWKPKVNLDQLINEMIEYEKKLSINS